MKSVFHSVLMSLALIVFSIQAGAADDSSMQQQIQDLKTRVLELERRLNVLESPEMMKVIEQASEPTNPGHSDDLSNWNRLNVGYNYDEVKELLGEPVRIKKGGMEFWFYSDQGLDGPFVKFLFRKVNSWVAPTGK